MVDISVKGKGQVANTGETVSYASHIVELVGSGSIVDSSGIIMTNRHVIENAYEIIVTFYDGTSTNARLLGKGLNFDLAVLKIDVGHALPAIKVVIATKSMWAIGSWRLAIRQGCRVPSLRA